jgi:histone H3/H4
LLQYREAKKWQGNKMATKNPLKNSPFERLVRELDIKVNGSGHRWTEGAIQALKEESMNVVTELFKTTNLLTVVVGNKVRT